MSPCAPARTHRLRDLDEVGRPAAGASRTPGRRDIRATAPTISTARSTCSAEHVALAARRRAPDRCTSIAATSGRPCSDAGQADVLLEACRPRSRRRPCAPAARGAAARRRRTRRCPGFCSPVDQTIPDGDSAIRGVGEPLLGLERDAPADHARRPCAGRRARRAPGRCRRTPRRPSPGVGNTSPAARSTASVRFTPATSAPPGDPRAAWAASWAPRTATGPTGPARG